MTYSDIFWREHDRETYECPGCGTRSGPWEVHHRNGRGFDDSEENLIALCRPCHRELHASGEVENVTTVEEWKEAFTDEVLVT